MTIGGRSGPACSAHAFRLPRYVLTAMPPSPIAALQNRLRVIAPPRIPTSSRAAAIGHLLNGGRSPGQQRSVSLCRFPWLGATSDSPFPVSTVAHPREAASRPPLRTEDPAEMRLSSRLPPVSHRVDSQRGACAANHDWRFREKHFVGACTWRRPALARPADRALHGPRVEWQLRGLVGPLSSQPDRTRFQMARP